jgi:hypothetical protein
MVLSNSELHALSEISVSPATVTFPSLVLYFQHYCHWCTDLLRDHYLALAQKNAATWSGNDKTDVKIVAIDCAVHPSAMSELNANATSQTVPHLVFHQSLTSQIPFTGDERTIDTLTSFIRKNNTAHELKGGGARGGDGDGDGDTRIRFYNATREQPRIKEHLQAALYGLNSLSRDEFGKPYKRMFEPSNASVYFIGIRRHAVLGAGEPEAPRPEATTATDTEIRSEIETPDEKHYELVVLLIPEKHVFRLRPDTHPVFGAIRGHRLAKLDVWMYVNVDPVRVVWEQLRKGFVPAASTSIVARLLRETFGFALRE